MTTTNTMLSALQANEPQIGLWLSLASCFSTEAVAGAGYDWALIDMEHSPNDLNTVMAQLQVLNGYATTAVVRPDWNDTVLVKKLLDAGAPGLLFPMIQSPQEAEKAVAACRYPPRGVRGVTGMSRANKFGRDADYFTEIEQQTLIAVQLETQMAVSQAEDIAAVDGVDGVFFGPADIAADLGLLGQPMHEQVWDLILPVADRLIAKGIPVGTLVLNAEFATKLVARGFSFVACGSDAGLLARGADSLLASMRGVK